MLKSCRVCGDFYFEISTYLPCCFFSINFSGFIMGWFAGLLLGAVLPFLFAALTMATLNQVTKNISCHVGHSADAEYLPRMSGTPIIIVSNTIFCYLLMDTWNIL